METECPVTVYAFIHSFIHSLLHHEGSTKKLNFQLKPNLRKKTEKNTAYAVSHKSATVS